MEIARREFIRLTVGLALASLGGRAGANGVTALPSNGGGKILADIVYQLFPHERLGKDVYEQVTEQLDRKDYGQSAELTVMMLRQRNGSPVR